MIFLIKIKLTLADTRVKSKVYLQREKFMSPGLNLQSFLKISASQCDQNGLCQM